MKAIGKKERFGEWNGPVELSSIEADGLPPNYAVADMPVSLSSLGALRSHTIQSADLGFDFSGPAELSVSHNRFFSGNFGRRAVSVTSYLNWFHQLFPVLSDVPQPKPEPEAADWSEDVLEITQALVQPLQLESAGGLEVHQEARSFDPRWNRETSRTRTTQFVQPDRWLSSSWSPGQHQLVNWCDDTTRGVWSMSFDLGRTRASEPSDRTSFHPGQRPHADTPLHRSHHRYTVESLTTDGDIVTLVLRRTTDSGTLSFQIDRKRNVVLRMEWNDPRRDRRTVTKYSDHVQVAGVWWPQTIQSFDRDEQLTSEIRQTVRLLEDAAFTAAIDRFLPADSVQLLAEPLPTYRDAKIASESGRAGFDDHLVLMLDALTTQNRDEVLGQLEQLAAQAADKPGMAWIRAAVLMTARRNEEARQQLLEQAASLKTEHGSRESEQNRTLAIAQYLISQLQQFGDANEQLRLIDELSSVYDGQPDYAGGRVMWMKQRADRLQNLGRVDEMLQLRRELAEAAPWEVYVQRQYAEALHQAGHQAEALKWLRQQLDRPEQRRPQERNRLQDAYASLLQRVHRFDDLVAFVDEWLAENPVQTSAYQIRLAALIGADRTDDADQQAREWLEAGVIAEEHSEAQRAALNAAILYCQGQYYNLGSNRFDPQWLDPLLRAVQVWLPHEHHFSLVVQVMGNHRFSNSDQADVFRREIAERLQQHAAELPVQQLDRYIIWTSSAGVWTTAEWMQLAEVLRTRWDAEENSTKRRQLGDALTGIYASHAITTDYLPFLRTRVQREQEEDSAVDVNTAVQRLFNALLSVTWTEENETEALSLLPQLTGNGTEAGRLQTQIQLLQRFVDSMQEKREAAAKEKLQAEDHPEELTRTELAERQAAIQRDAREGIAASVARAIDGLPQDRGIIQDRFATATLRDWLTVERMYLDLRLDRAQDAVADTCWNLLQALEIDPEQVDDDTQLTPDEAGQLQLTGQLRQRLLMMLSYQAVQRSAPAERRERLLTWIDDHVAKAADGSTGWHSRLISLLIALDQPDQLKSRLTEWIRQDEYPVAWQLMLGRLKAELGELQEAIELFESAERRQQLSAADQTMLASWYMAVDRKDDYQQRRVQAFGAMPEHQLQRWIQSRREPWTRTDVRLPTELDENVLFAFQALFKNSQYPGNYVYELSAFYTACRDFRLLKMVPDSVIGRTPQQVYSFLTGLRNNLLNELRNEATADEIVGRIQELRTDDRTTLDLRALDLLEAMIENQSSRVLNQPGPHQANAAEALRRAFRGEWADGEILQMAELLSRLGIDADGPLAAERLRQVRELFGLTQSGTDDHVRLAAILGRILSYTHGQRREGQAVLSAAVRAFEQSHPSGWPAHLNDVIGVYIELLQDRSRFAEAENVLMRQIENSANPSQRDWFRQRRYDVLTAALQRRGRVSLGTGRELFDNLLDLLITDAASGTDDHRYHALSRVPQVFRTAKDAGGIAYSDRLRQYAFDQFPALLRRQQSNYGSLVSNLAQTLRELSSVRVALEFLVSRMEQYPQRLEIHWQNAWRQHGRQLAEWRHQVNGGSNELQERVLALTLKELRRDLTTRESVQRVIYGRNSYGKWFWKEKENVFAAEAEAVLRESSSVFAQEDIPDAERPQTTAKRTIIYVAEYLRNDLRRYDRAIELMFIAHSHGLLDVSQQITLCHWLHERSRHAESIPLLEPIVRSFPQTMQYRVQLMRAFHFSERPEQCNRLLAETDEYFRQPGRWTEDSIASLAKFCVDSGRHEQAVAYYDEVIPLHQKSQADRGIGHGTLSGYYRYQARAYSRLGRTREAVEAASGSVISWGPSHASRSEAVSELRQVLQDAKDLDEYTASLDTESAASGQDSPLIRKQIGIAYRRRGEYQKAVEQLRQAIALQPGDPETHQTLLECYDALEDREAAIDQLLAMIESSRHDLDLYRKLAERLQDDPARSERAATSLVEADVQEAENHQALAELRQSQDRWQDAIQHWQHVAKLRSLEPTGLVNLARAQIHEKAWADAGESLKQLMRRDWPSRFGNIDQTVRQLQKQIPESR